MCERSRRLVVICMGAGRPSGFLLAWRTSATEDADSPLKVRRHGDSVHLMLGCTVALGTEAKASLHGALCVSSVLSSAGRHPYRMSRDADHVRAASGVARASSSAWPRGGQAPSSCLANVGN